MGSSNFFEWYWNFYLVFDCQGLIIDVCYNCGGNIDSIIFEKLLCCVWFYWKGCVGIFMWNMQYVFCGYMVVFVDENIVFDGEVFVEGFCWFGFGLVIGMCMWGGEIWLSSNNCFIDGGIVRVFQIGVYGFECEWFIEGWGVEFDIVVDNLLYEIFNGCDCQFEIVVDYLLQKIVEDLCEVFELLLYLDKLWKL